MNYNEDVLTEQLYIMKEFLFHYASYRSLHKEFEDLCKLGSQEYWVYTINAHYFQAINLWCMIFGTDSNEVHWKKLGVSGQIKPKIISTLGISSNDYGSYWRNLVEWRNKYSAHREPGYLKETPDLKIARSVVLIYESWITSNIDASIGFSLEEYEEQFIEELEETIRKILK